MILDKVDKYLMERESHKKESHYPTDVGKCSRQLWNDWHGTEVSNPLELSDYWRFLMGDAIHEAVDHILEKVLPGASIKEVAFKEDLGLKNKLSGRLDNIIELDGKLVGIEFKTSYGRKIAELRKTNSPDENYVLQVAMYIKYAKIDEFYLVYLGRDNGYRTEFKISVEGEQILVDGNVYLPFDEASIKAKFQAVAESDIVPDREYKATIVDGEFKDKFVADKIEYKADWQCSYCKYRSQCWKDILSQDGKFHGERKVV